MSRPDQLSAPAPIPVAVDEYLAREQTFFGQEHDQQAVITSATQSTAMRVMQEFFKVFLSDAIYGYSRLLSEDDVTRVDYIRENFLGQASFDRCTNTYGEVANIANALLKAKLSRSEHDIFTEKLRALGVTMETADANQRAEIERAISEHLKEQEDIFVRSGITLSSLQGVDFAALTPPERVAYAASGKRAQARELFLEHCPVLSDLISASIKPATDDLWDSDITQNEAHFPLELAKIVGNFSQSLIAWSSSSERSKKQLIKNTSYFAAQALSILTLYIQSIMTLSPNILSDLVERLATRVPASQGDQAKKVYIITGLVESFLLNGVSLLVDKSLRPNIHSPDHTDLPTYCSLAFSGIGKAITAIKAPASYDEKNNPYARLNYAIYLLSDMNNPSFTPEDRHNVDLFKAVLQTSSSMISLSASEIINAAESNPIVHQNIYRNLNELVSIFNFKAYYALSLKLKSSGNYRNVNALISKLGFDLDSATQQPCYVKTMASLYLSYPTNSANNKKVLEAVPPARQLEVYRAIVEMAFACSGMNEGEISDPRGVVSNLIGLRLKNYIDSKGISENVRFADLKPKQQAERNIAAAYQILVLLEQLKTYNAAESVSAENKNLAYNAVMNVVTDLVKQAEIRGYRGLVEGQSSQFAKLLNFDIPHTPIASRDGKKTIKFPEDFNFDGFNDIKETHESQNKRSAFKRSSNWIRQNSFTTAVLVLSGVLIALAGAALTLAFLSPALPIVLPFLSIAITASNLFAPAVIAALAGLSVSLISITFNSQNTAKAKMGYANLGKFELSNALTPAQSAPPVLAPAPRAADLPGAVVSPVANTLTPTTLLQNDDSSPAPQQQQPSVVSPQTKSPSVGNSPITEGGDLRRRSSASESNTAATTKAEAATDPADHSATTSVTRRLSLS